MYLVKVHHWSLPISVWHFDSEDPSYRKLVLMIGTAVNQTNPHKILNLNKIKVQNIMLKIFISKICKYKRGPKYENINIFFPFAKTFEMLRHAEPDFLKRNLVLIELLKKGPMK